MLAAHQLSQKKHFNYMLKQPKGGRFSPLNRQQLTHTICHLLRSTSYSILNSTTSATVFKVVEQPLLLQQASSLKPLADGTAMPTSCTYAHPQ